MALAIEWYLDQLSSDDAGVDSCTDPVLRNRIRWYIDWSMTQSTPSHVSRSVKQQILEAYLFSQNGRDQFAQSMQQPCQVRYDHYREIVDTRSQPFDWTWARVLNGIREALIEHENFFSILPEGERFTEPVFQLRRLMRQMFTLYQEALHASAGADLEAVIPGTRGFERFVDLNEEPS